MMTAPALTIPPHDFDLEVATLGAAFHSGTLARLIGQVDGTLFWDERNRTIHRALARLASSLNGAPPDLVLVRSLTAEDGAPVELRHLTQLFEAGLLVLDVTEPLVRLRELAAQREEVAIEVMLRGAHQLGETIRDPAIWRDVRARLQRADRFREPGAAEVALPWTWASALHGAAITETVVREPDWLIGGFLSRARQHAIIGASGSAKTWLEFGLAVAVAVPEVTEFLGQPVALHGPTVIESWEQGQAEDVRRLQKILRGHRVEIAPATLILTSTPFLTLRDEGAFQARLRDLRSAGTVLYVLDSLSEAAGVELNENTAYTAWWQARIRPLLEVGITVVFTHLRGHLKLGTTGDRDAAFRGATQIRALSTAVIECRQVSETSSLLVHNKHRDGPALPLGILTLTGGYEDPAITLTMTAKPDAANTALANRLRITEALGGPPLTAEALATATTLSVRTVKAHLKTLESEGAVASQREPGKAGRKLWSLAEFGPDDPEENATA